MRLFPVSSCPSTGSTFGHPGALSTCGPNALFGAGAHGVSPGEDPDSRWPMVRVEIFSWLKLRGHPYVPNVRTSLCPKKTPGASLWTESQSQWHDKLYILYRLDMIRLYNEEAVETPTIMGSIR